MLRFVAETFLLGLKNLRLHKLRSLLTALGIILGVAAALVFKPLPSLSRLGNAPWWVWVGGAFGAFYVAGSIVAAPRLGAAALIAVIVAGQSLASVVVDHFGWVGFEPKHVSAGRIGGMALVLAGAALVRFF